jgi:fatty acid hydroxylase domain-containing protein 2
MNEYIFYPYFIHLFTYWFFGGFFLILDLFPNKFYKFKIYKKKSIDWNLYKLTIKDVIFTHLFISFPFNIIISPLWNYFNCTWDSSSPKFYDFILILLIEEFLFYHIHYYFHKNNFLYKKIHKKHHIWKYPVAISAQYAHPIENILCNYSPFLIGCFITQLNFYYVLFLIFLGTFNAVNSHSGYKLIKNYRNNFHEKHHFKFNYNYGILGIFDYIHNTT